MTPKIMAEVMLVRWPEDAAEGERFADSGIAVLYLVNYDDEPPSPTTCIEDWIRIPGDDRDLRARVAALELRAVTHDSSPHVDDEGRLHYRGRVIVVSPHTDLVRMLTEQFGAVVPDHELANALRGGHASESLRAQMTQLRARLRPVDLVVRRVRRRGYLLQRR
jgi:hypothetical protein